MGRRKSLPAIHDAEILNEMVNNATQLDAVFSALADPTRRRILQGLRSGSAPVAKLAQPFRMSAPAVSRHLRVLESAGLVHRTKRGRIHEIALAAEPLHTVADWLETYRQHWESSLDALARYLEAPESAETFPSGTKTKKQTHPSQ
jgi:DNA-binding transcriptional ArsR family regulator